MDDGFNSRIVTWRTVPGSDVAQAVPPHAPTETCHDTDKRLKLAATFFAIVWSLGMIWWSGSADGANVVILSLCGIAGGIGWYGLMRWQLPHGVMPPRG